MQESFSNIQEMVASQIESIRQDVASNHSISDSPSHPPVQQAPCQGRMDPPYRKSRTGDGTPGTQGSGTEGAELATLTPSNVMFLLDRIREAGVQLPSDVTSRLGLTGRPAELSGNAELSQGEGLSSSGLGDRLGEGSSAGVGVGASGSGSGMGAGAQTGAGSQGASWFDDTVNVGASGSGSGAGNSRPLKPVTFNVPDRVLAFPGLDDDVSELGDRINALEGIRRVLHMLFSLCPEAAPTSEPARSKACKYEGKIAEQAKAVKEDLAPKLFHRVSEILEEAGSKFSSNAEAGKLSLLLFL